MARQKEKLLQIKKSLRDLVRNVTEFSYRIFISLITVEQKENKKSSQIMHRGLHSLRTVILNPIVVVIAFVGLLLFGWTQYTNASHDFSFPVDNLLPGSSFNVLQGGGVPIGWQLTKGGQLDDKVTYQDGYVSGRSLVLTVSHYHSGDLELVTPKVAVRPKITYLFKGFYTTSTNFDLLVRYNYSNGSSRLQLVHSYQSTSGLWTTDSFAFQSASNVQSVQFMYRVSMNGQLQLDDTYLEPSSDVYISPQPVLGNQLLSNADLSNSGSSPQGWSSYKSGNNNATFAYTQTSGVGPNVGVVVSSYKNGEAKWQPNPLPVTPGQYFQFSFAYTATSTSDVVAEFQLQNGTYVFDTAETLLPASGWTDVTVHFEVPANAVTMTPCVIMHTDGSLNTSQYSLYEETSQHPIRWARPLISLTFDDGHTSQYKNGALQLRTHGLVGTFYVNAATIDTSGFMSTTQLKRLQQFDDEVASHGYSSIDLTTVNASRLNAELQGSSQYIRQQFGDTTLDLATSDSNNDPQVSAYARKYYASLRGIEGGLNTRQNLDPYNLKVFYVTDHTSVATIENAISQAKAYNGWLIFVFHQIGVPSTGSNSDISLTAFQKQIQAIRASGVTVKTISSALTEIEKQQQ